MTSSLHLNTSCQQTPEGASQSVTLPSGQNDVLGFRYIDYRDKFCKKLESWLPGVVSFSFRACTYARTHTHTHESVDTQILTRFRSRSDSTWVPFALLYELLLIDENLIGIPMKFSFISKSTCRRAKGTRVAPDPGPKSRHIYACIPIHTRTNTQVCACVKESERECVWT